MKKVIGFAACCILVLNALAQTQPSQSQGTILAPAQSSSQWKDTYCAATKDDHIVVMNGKSELFIDMTLENGTKITTDGYVIKADGSKTALKSGECIDKNGNIINKKANNKK